MRYFYVILFLVCVGILGVSAFADNQKILGYEPLGCGQNVHSYAIAREC